MRASRERARTHTHLCFTVTARVPAESCAQYSRLLENTLARQQRRRRRWLCRWRLCRRRQQAASSSSGINSRAEHKFTRSQHNKNFSRLFHDAAAALALVCFNRFLVTLNCNGSGKIIFHFALRENCENYLNGQHAVPTVRAVNVSERCRLAKGMTCKSNPHLAVCVCVCMP